MIRYMYGMRLRGASPGAQPKEGLYEILDGDRKYWDYLVYDRKLTEKELENYDLDYIEEVRYER